MSHFWALYHGVQCWWKIIVNISHFCNISRTPWVIVIAELPKVQLCLGYRLVRYPMQRTIVFGEHTYRYIPVCICEKPILGGWSRAQAGCWLRKTLPAMPSPTSATVTHNLVSQTHMPEDTRDHWRLKYTEVQSQQMAFTQSPSVSNNPKIPTYVLFDFCSEDTRHKTHTRTLMIIA